MNVSYSKYNFDDIDAELDIIERIDYSNVYVDEKNKMCLLILGMLFANGVNINVINKDELIIPEEGKSFAKMTYVWDRLSCPDFPGKYYGNVVTKFDEIIENFKRMGVSVEKIYGKTPQYSRQSFLICPVRNATPDQKRIIENFVYESENEGMHVYAPHMETRQKDILGGYSICMQNAQAIASSKDVWIYYDKNSTGSVFDIGVAYALGKPLHFLNNLDNVYDENDFIDNLVKNWPYEEGHVKTRH